nr:MAG TPA: hypothetical protein [Caudoviricetes sp.]
MRHARCIVRLSGGTSPPNLRRRKTMNTYLIDTNADTDRLLLDGDREALVTAAVRLTGEDRELLASNGYKITED